MIRSFHCHMDGRLAVAYDGSGPGPFPRGNFAPIRRDGANHQNKPAAAGKKTPFNNQPRSTPGMKADGFSAIGRDAFFEEKKCDRWNQYPLRKVIQNGSGACRIRFLKNYGWAFLIAVNILLASLGAKNRISYPLGYDFSCSYGVPLAVWETYSIDQKEQSRLIDGAYHVSAVEMGSLGNRSVIFNSIVDLIVFLAVFYLLQKRKDERRWERGLRKSSFVLVFLLSLSLWGNVFSSWESGVYRFLYLAALFLEILLVLSAIIKGVTACSVRRAEQIPTSRAV